MGENTNTVIISNELYVQLLATATKVEVLKKVIDSSKFVSIEDVVIILYGEELKKHESV